MLFPEYAGHVVMVYNDDEFAQLIGEFTPRGFFAINQDLPLLEGHKAAVIGTDGGLVGLFDDVDDAADAIDPILPL
ncbi:MAG: hypothetical protein SPI77_05605 [Corynebacterium sp.]|nr:hypothetical protein [Corynebacterium sp.]